MAELLERDETVHARQPDIEDDHIEGRSQHAVEARLTAVYGFDGISLVAQDAARRAADARLVVHDQDRRPQLASSFQLPVASRQVLARLSPVAFSVKPVACTLEAGNWKLVTVNMATRW